MRVRKSNSQSPITLSDINGISDNPDQQQNSYMFMKNIRGTVAYWKDVLFNLIAMIKNLGSPSLFITLSAYDYHWAELANTLNVPIDQLPKAVQANPFMTSIHFERRWTALLHKVILGKQKPLGSVEDYFCRVELQ